MAGAIFLIATAIALAQPPDSPRELGPAWVRQRIAAWQPSERERMWEKIGWAKDIRDAERIARAANRPVFLFTHDGRLNVGRC